MSNTIRTDADTDGTWLGVWGMAECAVGMLFTLPPPPSEPSLNYRLRTQLTHMQPLSSSSQPPSLFPSAPAEKQPEKHHTVMSSRLVNKQTDLQFGYLKKLVPVRDFLSKYPNCRSVCLLTSLMSRKADKSSSSQRLVAKATWPIMTRRSLWRAELR
jgi:hypothetical protein